MYKLGRNTLHSKFLVTLWLDYSFDLYSPVWFPGVLIARKNKSKTIQMLHLEELYIQA